VRGSPTRRRPGCCRGRALTKHAGREATGRCVLRFFRGVRCNAPKIAGPRRSRSSRSSPAGCWCALGCLRWRGDTEPMVDLVGRAVQRWVSAGWRCRPAGATIQRLMVADPDPAWRTPVPRFAPAGDDPWLQFIGHEAPRWPTCRRAGSTRRPQLRAAVALVDAGYGHTITSCCWPTPDWCELYPEGRRLVAASIERQRRAGNSRSLPWAWRISPAAAPDRRSGCCGADRAEAFAVAEVGDPVRVALCRLAGDRERLRSDRLRSSQIAGPAQQLAEILQATARERELPARPGVRSRRRPAGDPPVESHSQAVGQQHDVMWWPYPASTSAPRRQLRSLVDPAAAGRPTRRPRDDELQPGIIAGRATRHWRAHRGSGSATISAGSSPPAGPAPQAARPDRCTRRPVRRGRQRLGVAAQRSSRERQQPRGAMIEEDR